MTSAAELFVEQARGVSIADAADRLGLRILGRRDEHPQPCPACGGTDCFAFNTRKNKWNCRAGGVGGHDAIGMAAHIHDLDVRRQADLLEACSIVLGEDVPDGNERPTEAERAARRAAIEKRRRENQAAAEERESDRNRFKVLERSRAAGIAERARPLTADCAAHRYLQARLRTTRVFAHRLHVRYAPEQTYWHGRDAAGRAADIHAGPAMIGKFVDGARNVIGCHITWIDLARPPKFRPVLGLDEKGRAIPTRKMRGSKKGGLIPVAGDWHSSRWIVGEGIETVAFVALAEDFPDNTFYCAAGDIGNLAGAAASKGRTRHPTLRKTDKRGRERAVMVPSPFPDPGRLDGGFPVADHVRECVLLAENDSDRLTVAARMACGAARIRMIVPACSVAIAWPPAGYGDFCDLAEMKGRG